VQLVVVDYHDICLDEPNISKMGTNSRSGEKVFILFFLIKLRESVVQKKKLKKENREYSGEKEPLRNKSYFSFK
jgi:hypothetical protein